MTRRAGRTAAAAATAEAGCRFAKTILFPFPFLLHSHVMTRLSSSIMLWWHDPACCDVSLDVCPSSVGSHMTSSPITRHTLPSNYVLFGERGDGHPRFPSIFRLGAAADHCSAAQHSSWIAPWRMGGVRFPMVECGGAVGYQWLAGKEDGGGGRGGMNE